MTSSHSKAFIYFKSPKIICQEANLQVYQKKLFLASSFMYFVLIFSERITITSSKEALKVCKHNLFQRKPVLLSIYLFNYH